MIFFFTLVLQQINAYGSYNKIINSSNTNINPVTITVDNQKILSLKSGKSRSLKLSLKVNKYLYCFVLLLMIIFGLLLFTTYVLKIKKDEYEKLLEDQQTRDEMIPLNDRSKKESSFKNGLILLLYFV